jgi:hypothetical protein
VFALVKLINYRGKAVIKVVNKTQKELIVHFRKSGERYELLEFHKTKDMAQKRFKEMTKHFQTRLPKRYTKGSIRGMREAKLGEKNPMYGPISDERRAKISKAMMGNQNRRGTGDTPAARRVKSRRAKKQNSKRFTGRVWCFNPVTEKERFVFPADIPEGFVRGRNPDVIYRDFNLTRWKK